jgi:5'-nucleotidase
VHEHLGADEDSPAYKRLMLTHHKDLNKGDFLVDDRPNNGADKFDGEWIQFGSRKFRSWRAVLKYLRPKA